MSAEKELDVKGINHQMHKTNSIEDEETHIPKTKADCVSSLQKLPASSHSPSKGEEMEGFIADIFGTIDCLLQNEPGHSDKELDNNFCKVNTPFCAAHNSKEGNDQQKNVVSGRCHISPHRIFDKSSTKDGQNLLTVPSSQDLYPKAETKKSECVGYVNEKNFDKAVSPNEKSISVVENELSETELKTANETGIITLTKVENDFNCDRLGLTKVNSLDNSNNNGEVSGINLSTKDFNGGNTQEHSPLNSKDVINSEDTTHNAKEVESNVTVSEKDEHCTHRTKIFNGRRKSESISDTYRWSRLAIPSDTKFLSLDRALKGKMHNFHDKPQLKSISNDSLTVKPLQRKYSAPACFYKVQKVISIDIPKMENFVMQEQSRNSHRHRPNSALEVGSFEIQSNNIKENYEDTDLFVKKKHDISKTNVSDQSDAKYDEIDWNGNLKISDDDLIHTLPNMNNMPASSLSESKVLDISDLNSFQNSGNMEINEDDHLQKPKPSTYADMSGMSVAENKVLDKDFKKASDTDLNNFQKNFHGYQMKMEVNKDAHLNETKPNTNVDISGTSVERNQLLDEDFKTASESNPNCSPKKDNSFNGRLEIIEDVDPSKIVPNTDVQIPVVLVTDPALGDGHFKNEGVSDPNSLQSTSSYGNSKDVGHKKMAFSNVFLSCSSSLKNMSLGEDFEKGNEVDLSNSQNSDYDCDGNMEVNEVEVNNDAHLNLTAPNTCTNVNTSGTSVAENICKSLNKDCKKAIISDRNNSIGDYRIGNKEVNEDSILNEVQKADVGMLDSSVVEIRVPDGDIKRHPNSSKVHDEEDVETPAFVEVKDGSTSKVNMQETLVWDPGAPIIPPRVKINKPMRLKKHLALPETPPPPSPHTTEQLIINILNGKVTKRDRQTTISVADRRQKEIDKRMPKNIYLKPDFESTRKQVDVKGITKTNIRNKSAHQKKILNKFVGSQPSATLLKEKRKSRDMMDFLESYKLVENFRYQNKQKTGGDSAPNCKFRDESTTYSSVNFIPMKTLEEEKPEELKQNTAVTQPGYSMTIVPAKHIKNKSTGYSEMQTRSDDNIVKLHDGKLSEKPQSFSEKVKTQYEDSPDFQVIVNASSPVLLRRNASRMEQRNSSSVTSSPDRKAKVYESNRDKNISMETLTVPELHPKPLLMDPKQARTWHGTTNLNWSKHYEPECKTDGEIGSSNNSLNADKSDSEMDPIPLTGKSLLDEMHKKFCSDQYSQSQNLTLARDITLLRLKSARANESIRRSQSFNIRMGTGKPSSSISRDGFASLKKTHKRIGIKTIPDLQYSPRLSRAAIDGQSGKIPEIKVPAQKTETEIEAIEACRWLRETGFPQYAQLYEDGQFPLDIESVEKDHDFLDKEDIQSLFKRLNTLNKCAVMKIGTPAKKEAEDSDEEEQCALSDKWKYQRSCRRWSRKDLEPPVIANRHDLPILRSTSSHDSLLADQNSSSETGDSPVLDSKMHHIGDGTLILNNSTPFESNATRQFGSKVIQRTASEKIKGAKGFLKRMESLKSRKSRKHKTITEISDPVPANRVDMQAKIKHLNCKEIKTSTDNNSHPLLVSSSPASKLHDTSDDLFLHSFQTNINTDNVSGNGLVKEPLHINKDDSSSSSSTSATPSVSENTLDLSISTNGFSGHDLSPVSKHSNSSETTNSSEETVFITSDHKLGKFPTTLDDSLFKTERNVCARSFSYSAESDHFPGSRRSGRGSHDPKKRHNRVSIYDNVPIEEDLQTAQKELDIILSELFQNINGMNKAIYGDSAELLELPSFSRFEDNISVDSSALSNDPAANLSSDFTNEHEGNKLVTGALSSPDTSDHEHTEGLSNDESLGPTEKGERRDSGVGSSLTRTNCDRRKYRIRWHSFQKTHRPSLENHNLQINCLSAGQIMVLHKLSLLKLTALIENYSPNRSGWSLSVPRFMKRHKMPDYKDKHVFGIPFTVMIQRTGQALPQCILHAMRFLRRTSGDAVGLFRKSGVRSRIQKLRSDIEANPEIIDYEEQQAYDLADLVKQFFRELPECLLTNKLSDIFISIFTYVPEDLRLEALQAAIILMADENRDVLLSLLLFLGDIAKHHNKHQMTASNLAVCFAPSLFNMCGTRHPNLTPSPRRTRKNIGVPDARELMEQKAAHECLTVMIQECKRIFTIPAATLVKCRIRHSDPVTLDQLSGDDTSDGNHGYASYVDACIQGLLKESREKFRGWVSVSIHNDVDVSFKKVGDGHPLRLWKCTVDVEAPPDEVLNRILHERQIWDEDLLQWHTVQKLDDETDVFQYVRNSMAPHPTREYLVLRSWRTNLPKGACVLVSTSIEHTDTELQGGIRAVELASRYLIEPCGAGKSRLTHISRIDIRGHSPEWYKKVYGHICANFMAKICSSFKTKTNGPETKV